VQSENQQNEGIFTCSNDGCMSSFNTHQELHYHAILDECNLQSEKIKKSDMLKTQYIKKLSEAQITPKEVTISGNCSEIESKQTLSQGWGIKLERKNKRFTEN
jgi:Fe2+ or Zn2+ uptake regulation protein